MKNDKTGSFHGITGLCCVLLHCTVMVIFGKMTFHVGGICALAAIMFGAISVIKHPLVSDILYVAADIACIAIPLLFSPALAGVVWMMVMVAVCPLVTRKYPGICTTALLILNCLAVAATFILRNDMSSGPADFAIAAGASVAAAVISQRARKAQESDKRRHARTIELLEDEKAELATGSMTDPLTGLFNKGYYEMILPKMIAAHHQYGHPLTAIFVDIDHFKSINDTYGHDAGDRALISLAGALQKFFRREEIMRFGGEEFLILLSVDAFTAYKRTEALRREIENMKVDGFGFTISAGIAEYAPDMADQELTKAADEQMYRAKNSGRNKICM